jgi:hypothetical protein
MAGDKVLNTLRQQGSYTSLEAAGPCRWAQGMRRAAWEVSAFVRRQRTRLRSHAFSELQVHGESNSLLEYIDADPVTPY